VNIIEAQIQLLQSQNNVFLNLILTSRTQYLIALRTVGLKHFKNPEQTTATVLYRLLYPLTLSSPTTVTLY